MKPKVTILGSGNVATHLAAALAKEADIVCVYNHNMAGASALAERVGATPTDNTDDITDNVDIYIIAVKDDAISELAQKIGRRNGLWVHTSGSVSQDVLSSITDTYGVLYPMQTFSKDVPVNMDEVPLFIEASDTETLDRIRQIARLISGNVHEADSALRSRLHIAAVFACNFTNYLWSHADDLLRRDGLSLEIMKPLILATLDKAIGITPAKGQTGPARRNDTKIIDRHLSMLSGETKEIYENISRLIVDKYNHQ